MWLIINSVTFYARYIGKISNGCGKFDKETIFKYKNFLMHLL